MKFDSGRCLYGLDKYSTCAACTNLCPAGAIQPAAGPACTFCKHGPQENRESISNEQLTDSKTDYTRLFVGVGNPIAPPRAPVYFNEDRMIFQEQTIKLPIIYPPCSLLTLLPPQLHLKTSPQGFWEISDIYYLLLSYVGFLSVRGNFVAIERQLLVMDSG